MDTELTRVAPSGYGPRTGPGSLGYAIPEPSWGGDCPHVAPRSCPACDGTADDDTAAWAWGKAKEAATKQARILGRALTEDELDRLWLSFLPHRLRWDWADEIAARNTDDTQEDAA